MITRICVLLGLCASAVVAQSQAPAQHCPIRASPSVDLTLADGRTVYVEANSFASQGEMSFLAGRPNFITRGMKLDAKDSSFGVLFTTPGSAQLVPLPANVGNASNPRVLPIGEGRWGAVFAEVAPSDSIRYSHVRRLWYAVYDGTAWSTMEQLPIPAVGWLRGYATSALTANGDTLTFAIPLDSVRVGKVVATRVAVFTRNHGRWSTSILPTTYASYVEAISLGAAGMRIAVVMPDSSRRPSDSNSLFIYGPAPDWPSRGVLVQGGDRPIHYPILRDQGGRYYLSWMEIPDGSPWIAHSYSGTNADLLSNPVTRLDSSAVTAMDSNVLLLMQTTADGLRTRWLVTDNAVSSTSLAAHELRLYDDSTGTPRLLASVANQYTGEVAQSVLLRPSGRILVAGPRFYGSWKGPAKVTTGVVEFDQSCQGT